MGPGQPQRAVSLKGPDVRVGTQPLPLGCGGEGESAASPPAAPMGWECCRGMLGTSVALGMPSPEHPALGLQGCSEEKDRLEDPSERS